MYAKAQMKGSMEALKAYIFLEKTDMKIISEQCDKYYYNNS